MKKPRFQYPWRAAMHDVGNGQYQPVTENSKTGETINLGQPGTIEDARNALTAGYMSYDPGANTHRTVNEPGKGRGR